MTLTAAIKDKVTAIATRAFFEQKRKDGTLADTLKDMQTIDVEEALAKNRVLRDAIADLKWTEIG